MARTVEEIYQEIITNVQADSTLGAVLTSTSAVAIWRRWCFVMAMAAWVLEVLFDNHKAEVEELVAAQKPHTLRWYREKALTYQHGGSLGEGVDTYDNTGLSDATIEAQKIIKQAAANETGGLVTIKVAKESSGELVALDSTEHTGVSAYFAEIKDAGVFLEVRSVVGDDLYVVADVYIDTKILDVTGARLDGAADTPVLDAIKNFLRNLPFDALFIPQKMVDAIQAVEGVRTINLRECKAKRNDDATFSNVPVWYSPYAGYFKNNPSNLLITHEIE